MLAFLSSNLTAILGVLLLLSETLSTIQVLLFPNASGFGGILAGIIKFLKSLGAQDPAPPAPPAA